MARQENIRELALDVLLTVEKQHEQLNKVLQAQLLKYQYLDKQKRAFLTRLCEGTWERKIYLDYVINQFSKIPVAKCKPLIREVLRLSVYQIFFMHSVPDSAAIDESVKLVKKRGFARLSGFVNGVLRNISRNQKQIIFPDETKDFISYASVMYSMPKWIVLQWIEQYGEVTAQKMLQASNETAPIYFRIHSAKTNLCDAIKQMEKEGMAVCAIPELTIEGFEDVITRLKKESGMLTSFDYLTRYSSFLNGLFSIQDLSSMFPGAIALSILESKTGNKKVLDMCSAPGGKTTHIACDSKEDVSITAWDISEQKVDKIRQNCERLGLFQVTCQVHDALVDHTKLHKQMDVVLCDVPCSGLGVLGRKKDIRYNMSLEQQESLISLQRQILNAAVSYVKEDGSLIYSTCTVNQKENRQNVMWFLKEHTDFCLIREMQFLPGVHPCDGFYVAQLQHKR